MKLSKLRIKKFFSYQDAEVTFPEAGLLMVVGANGSGKSALGIEALAWTLWGETVRGSEPDPEGRVEAWFEDTVVTRERSERKLQGLGFRIVHDGGAVTAMEGQTPTETQAKINRAFGDWGRFKNTRVFSRSLLSKFGNATNKERQTLLESILGLEQFSRAEKHARGAMVMRRAASLTADGELSAATASLERARAALGGEPIGRHPGVIQVEIDFQEKLLGAAEEILEATRLRTERARMTMRKTEDAAAARRTRVVGLLQQRTALTKKIEAFERLGRAADCPVCLQPLNPATLENATQHIEAEGVPLDLERKKLLEEVAVLEEDLADQQRALAELERRHKDDQTVRQGVAVAIANLRSELRVASDRAATAERLQKMVEVDQRRVNAAELAAAKARRALQVAEAAVEALGPRGAKVKVLDGALRRLQAETNRVLARIASSAAPLSVRISGKKLQASGREVDEVSLEVEGAGAGRYSGASDGERTRVDVALLLALSRMAGEDGLLLFDEIFDPLDDEGLERVAELLQDYAKERQIIVCSHNAKLQALVPSSSVWEVTKVGGVSSVKQGGS